MSAPRTNYIKPMYVVEPGRLLNSNPRDLWAYRELLVLLVKRDFVAAYKQTALGPFWFFVQPFVASLTFIVVFSQIARLSTTDLPPRFLFAFFAPTLESLREAWRAGLLRIFSLLAATDPQSSPG